jgi:hypothetical protein
MGAFGLAGIRDDDRRLHSRNALVSFMPASPFNLKPYTEPSPGHAQSHAPVLRQFIRDSWFLIAFIILLLTMPSDL